MPVLKLHAENIGPFEKLELDLTDGRDNAHPGPHILAGVNGSGKTTVLRTIAWCLSERSSGFDSSGFDKDAWNQFLDPRKLPKALLEYRDVSGQIQKRSASTRNGVQGGPVNLGCIGTYRPSPSLFRLEETGLGNRDEASSGWLSFEREKANLHVQQFWVAALSRSALAKQYGEQTRDRLQSAESMRHAVSSILGDDFEASLNIDGPFPLPSVKFRGQNLNLSQLAAGFNATLSWLVDFLLRQEYFQWEASLAAVRPGLILIDEIETHLHPQWQRRILSGIQAAFPKTQIIVTTHSPFVVSSCPGARLHLFKVDETGKAYLYESLDAPVGASISANIMDVFDISSEFGPPIEKKLDEWNNLKRRDSIGALSLDEGTRLRALSGDLASQGEELASIVADPPVLPQSLIDELVASATKSR